VRGIMSKTEDGGRMDGAQMEIMRAQYEEGEGWGGPCLHNCGNCNCFRSLRNAQNGVSDWRSGVAK
jgi:hypothetical protein